MRLYLSSYGAPHYRSIHPESGLIENVIDYFIYSKIPFIALRDGDAHISDQSAMKSFP